MSCQRHGKGEHCLEEDEGKRGMCGSLGRGWGKPKRMGQLKDDGALWFRGLTGDREQGTGERAVVEEV